MNKTIDNAVKFREVQRFRQKWLLIGLREYGGWGVKYGRAGKAYNVSGNRSVQLKLSSGKGLLIGSQRPEELAQAIQEGIRGYTQGVL